MSDPTANISKASTLSSASQRPLFIWPVALFALALVIRLVYALQVPFPPLDDPAYYVQGARSLRQGTFFDMGITWNYAFKFDTVVRPGFDFWMPLASFLIAGTFLFLGDTPFAAQLPSVLFGAGLTVLTFYVGRRAFEKLEVSDRTKITLAGLSGLYVAVNPLLSYQSVTPDSMMSFGLLAAVGLLFYWDEKPGRWAAFGFGVAVGLAYLARTHALLLLAAWGLVMLARLYKNRRSKPELFYHLANIGLVGLGLALTMGPWLLRNYLTFGSLTARSMGESVFMYQLSTFYNYETPVTLQSFLSYGWGEFLSLRWEALRNVWLDLLGTLFFPLGLVALLGLYFLWKKNKSFNISLLYGFLTMVVLPLLVSVVSINGTVYHSIASLGPVGAVGLIYLLWQVGQWLKVGKAKRFSLFPLLVALFLVIEIVQFGIAAPSVIEGHRTSEAKFARLKTWLDANMQGPAVITDEPSTVNYVTGIPALRLPADESLEVVQKLAKKFNVKYIVVTSALGRYPDLLYSPENTFFPRVYKDAALGEFEVFLVP